MKDRTLQKKRRAASNGGLMILHSKTGPRRRQRVAAGSAAAADLGSDVPNLGVARALLVILLLHVAAIAAIFVHNKVTDEDPVVMRSAVQEAPKALAAVDRIGREEPKVARGEDYYFVATGDTYDKIARAKGVDVTALKELNNNVALRAGRILRLPTEAAVPAAAQVPARPAPSLVVEPPRAVVAEPVALVEPTPEPEVAAPRATIVEEPPAPVAAVEEAVRVTPRIAPPAAEPLVAVAVEEEPTGIKDSGVRHKVKSGDSVWGITRRYKVKQDELLELNGIANPNKLRAGMELKIPVSN